MNNYQSIATINGPEFINLQPLDVNPGMVKCEIKVLYLGPNRNGTSIDKEAATQMARTLRGAPIVGYYRQDKQDFFDHGEQIIYDGDGVHFNVLTKPYGYVAPDSPVWFQEFEEVNEAGESITRVYLMTIGYLWAGQFKEAQQVFNDGGKAQSMELDENSLQGFWSNSENSDFEFFIINDAVFSKLCILGDDVEPCFEGASITAPNVSKSFSLENDYNFKKTLYTMMKELQETLQGGMYKVADEVKKKSIDSSEPAIDEAQVENPSTDNSSADTPNIDDPADIVDNAGETPGENTETPGADAGEQQGDNAETPSADTENAEGSEEEGGNASSEGADASSEGGDSSDGGGAGSSEYAKKDDEEDSKEDDTEETDDSSDAEKEEDDDDKKKEDKYSLLVVEYEELQKSYSDLQAQNEELTKQLAEFKNYVLAAENEKKDALIADFYMLSDEDKKDVIDHKAEYSLDEIKSKLAVLCYDKKVSYVKDDESTTNMTVNINNYSNNEEMPEWLAAVESHKAQQ